MKSIWKQFIAQTERGVRLIRPYRDSIEDLPNAWYQASRLAASATARNRQFAVKHHEMRRLSRYAILGQSRHVNTTNIHNL